MFTVGIKPTAPSNTREAMKIQFALIDLNEDTTDTLEEWYFQLRSMETCHHGMALWLCADPVSHYPRDL